MAVINFEQKKEEIEKLNRYKNMDIDMYIDNIPDDKVDDVVRRIKEDVKKVW